MVETNNKTRLHSLIIFALLLVSFIGLLIRSSFFPYPEILTEIYFRNRGMLPYTQINDQHFPGVMLLPLNLSILGVHTATDLKVVHIFLASLNLFILYRLVRNTSLFSQFFALLSYIVYFLLWEGNTLWIDSFVTTLSLLGFYLLFSGRSFRNLFSYLLTGLIFGSVVLLKQHGIFLALTSFIWVLVSRPSFPKLISFVVGGILPMSLALVHLYRIGVLPDFWFWTVTHNLSGYTGLEGKLPKIGEVIKFVILFLPATFSTSKKQFLTTLFIISSLVYLFPRFGLIHAQVVLPFLILVIFTSACKSRFSLLLKITPVVLGLLLTIRFIAKDTPGTIKFYDPYSLITADFVKSSVDPNRPIYVYGVNDNIYHLTNTLPPKKTWIELLKGNIIPGVEDLLISTLVADPPQFILVDPNSSIDDENTSQFTPLIYKYIKDYYESRITLPNQIQVWYAKNQN